MKLDPISAMRYMDYLLSGSLAKKGVKGLKYSPRLYKSYDTIYKHSQALYILYPFPLYYSILINPSNAKRILLLSLQQSPTETLCRKKH